uniref:ACA2 n=1 Tax=Arundo donax TaxID=35708 RepID=A0A0A9AN90_ARUDO
MHSQLLSVTTFNNGCQFIGTNLKPSSFNTFRNNILTLQ